MYRRQTFQDFYNGVKGSNWPKCESELDIKYLPKWIKTELRAMGFNFSKYPDETFITSGSNSIVIKYAASLDGGGTALAEDFIEIINERYEKTFNSCLEWCSGPGFIGFSILSNNLCNSLCLVDLYDPAITCAETTIKENQLDDIVDTYLLKDLSLLPKNKCFDLIVANPPHWNATDTFYYNETRICIDQNWRSHQNFFKNVKHHLTTDGIILLAYSVSGSNSKTFESYINAAGLKITDCFMSKNLNQPEKDIEIYYLEIQHSNENIFASSTSSP
jgi:16S rRNA G966 N2-methylase RsmD